MRSPLRQLQQSPLQSQKFAGIDRKGKESASVKPERRKVFRRPPMSSESVSLTRTDGQRLYLSIKCDKEEEAILAQSKVNENNK